MHALYTVSVFLHILAAITWIGGMFFLVLVVVPWLRKGDRARAATLMRETGTRFRDIGWVCFAILLVTGTFNLWVRGVRFSSFTDEAWLASSFGRAVMVKLSVFALVLVVSAVHDFSVGPRASHAIEADPRSPESEGLRKSASKLGRLNVLLALVLVYVGVVLVRGWPW
jgi:copper resistance protein D